MIIDPRGKFVYVANAESNTVSILEIDAQTGTLQNVATVSTGARPWAVTITSAGKYLYALNHSSQNLSAYGIDPVSGQLTPLSGSPFSGSGSSNSIVADPFGKRLYAASVTTIIGFRVFDNRGNLHALPQSPFAGVSNAYGLGFDFSDSFLYAANNSGNTVSVFRSIRRLVI